MELPVFTSFMTLVAVGQFFFFSFMVGRARVKHNVPAPATYGNPEFERVFRVQQNTMEQLIFFLPSMWLFAFWVNDFAAGLLAILWVVGRELYGMSYIKDPDSRGKGFMLSMAAGATMWIGSLVAIIYQEVSSFM